MLLALGGYLLATTTAAAEVPLSDHDLVIGKSAFAAADAGHWAKAEDIVHAAEDPLLAKIICWADFVRLGGGHGFDELSRFIDNNPDWPYLGAIRLRVEDAIAGVDDDRVGQWFGHHHPITPLAELRQADLLMAQGRSTEAVSLIRHVWVSADLSATDEAGIRDQYHAYLRPQDDTARLDRLVWEEKPADARRLFAHVSPDWRNLAEARLALAAELADAPDQVAKVSRKLLRDPGLAFERARWYRRKDKDSVAADIMARQGDLGRPDIWWPERQILVRRLLNAKQPQIAYRLILNHRMTEPQPVAEAEFTAGWIALRFLKQPGKALTQFQHLADSAHMPVTLARGAYWAGRAAQALGQNDKARSWYERAATYSATFYGQLAGAMPDVAVPDMPVPEPAATPDEVAAFDQKELVRAIRMLLALGQEERAKPFLTHLTDLATTTADYALIADFAEAVGRPDLGVAIAKKASYAGVSLMRAGYPIIWMPPDSGTEQPLLLALTRQESAFDLRALSPAGARGLMQLMPTTARQVALARGMGFSSERLLSDGVYNVTLGQSYFDSLVQMFGGSYVLAITAYNAGPVRVQQWIDTFGDPRRGEIDPVDWIESVPFGETRNYVQRVLENLQVYRLRTGDRKLAFSLPADLQR